MDILFDLWSIIVGAGDKVRHQWHNRHSYMWDYSYNGRYKPDNEE